ncbi:MAG: hypothetical protein ABL998_20715, partial [Planctomycetota bacterium]
LDACRRAGWSAADPTVAVVGELEGQGFLRRAAGRVSLSSRGWPLADAIARRLLTACAADARPPGPRE